jgi:hypothetical protein
VWKPKCPTQATIILHPPLKVFFATISTSLIASMRCARGPVSRCRQIRLPNMTAMSSGSAIPVAATSSKAQSAISSKRRRRKLPGDVLSDESSRGSACPCRLGRAEGETHTINRMNNEGDSLQKTIALAIRLVDRGPNWRFRLCSEFRRPSSARPKMTLIHLFAGDVAG